MKKKLCALFLVLALLLPFCVSVAAADTGPKRSVEISISGGSGEPFLMTLLGDREIYGPYSTLSQEELEENWEDYQELLPLWEYQDADGFSFWMEYQTVEETPYIYRWRYMPPQVFKVLLYFPDSNQYVVSPIYTTYAFHSSYTMDLSSIENGQITLEKSYDFGSDLVGLLVRTALTLLVELLVALPFLYWTRETLPVILVTNVVTQLLLNVALGLLIFFRGNGFLVLFFWYVLFELAVFAIEAVVYVHKFPASARTFGAKPVLYALVANLASYLAGVALWNYFPQFF